MNEPNDGGPAFPSVLSESSSSCSPVGMSLRDWFAGMAFQGLLSNPVAITELIEKNGLRLNASGFYRIALSAMVAADAMLTTRKNERTNDND